jgi:hypothetical protein
MRNGSLGGTDRSRHERSGRLGRDSDGEKPPRHGRKRRTRGQIKIRGQVSRKGRFERANWISRIQRSKRMRKIEQNWFSNDAYKRMCIDLYDKRASPPKGSSSLLWSHSQKSNEPNDVNESNKRKTWSNQQNKFCLRNRATKHPSSVPPITLGIFSVALIYYR